MAEIRNRREGYLYRIAASGSGTAWTTASGASGYLLAFVRDFTWTSAKTDQVIMDRGLPSHHKNVSKDAIQVNFTVGYAVTAAFPTAVTGDGSTVPMDMVEFKMTGTEAGVGIYYQFYGVDWNSKAFTEGDQENTQQFQGLALGMCGPTGSGFMG